MNSKVTYATHYDEDAVRKHPNIYLGSNGLSGAQHTVLEIIGNALDEAADGYGDVIEVSYSPEGIISVRDYGRGVPLGWNPDYKDREGNKTGAWMWDRLFNTMYSSGKYSNEEVEKELLAIEDWSTFNPQDYPYLFSVGTHGVGAKVTQFTSEYFVVTQYTGTESHTMRFEKGRPVYKELRSAPSTEPRGTYIEYRPDSEVFTDTHIPSGYFYELCRNFSILPGIRMQYTDPSGNVTVFEPSSLGESFADKASERPLTNKTFYHTVDAGHVQLCETESYIAPWFGNNTYFNNLVTVRGGVHSSAVSSAVHDFYTNILKGIKLTPNDYYSELTVWVSTRCNQVDYHGQTKDALENKYVEDAVYLNISELLGIAYSNREPWLLASIERVRTHALDRINSAINAKEIKEVKKAIKSASRPKKFVSCAAYERGQASKVELFLPEGDSANSSLVLARNAETQCMLPQRGKPINLYKASAAKAMANAEIQDLAAVLGCGIHTGDASTFNINKLKVGKIILASDADIDGWHIRNLNFLNFYKFFPELLYQGYVYIAETPRYSIKYGDGTVEYFRDDESYQEAKANPRARIEGTQRYKGLGEVNPDVLAETTVNPASRSLVQLRVSPDDAELLHALELMYGEDTELRKRLIIDLTNSDGYDGYMATLRKFVEREQEALAELNETYDYSEHEEVKL